MALLPVKPAMLVPASLALLVLLPLLAVGLLLVGFNDERARFGDYAAAANQLQAVQDAEVDFALARRAGQSYLRTGDAADRSAASELIARARVKLAAARKISVGDATNRALDELDGHLARDAATAESIFDLAARRRLLRDQRLPLLAELIDAELAAYTARWQRAGLGMLATAVLQARAAVADPTAAFGPDDLAQLVARPLALAATAEIAEPEAGTAVRRLELRFAAFETAWRQLREVSGAIATAMSGDRGDIGHETTLRFESVADALTRRQTALFGASKLAESNSNRSIAIVGTATLIFAAIGAFAAWRVFGEQSRRAAKEKAKRKALEAAFAQLEAAARTARARAAPPANAEPIPQPVAAQDMPTIELAPEIPAEIAPEIAPVASIAAPAPVPAPPVPAAAADPGNDELIKMLLNSLPPTQSAKAS